MASAQTKTCPVCGAANNANDLFCRECGSSLASVVTSGEQTAAFAPVEQYTDAQTTAVTPVATPTPAPQYGYSPLATPSPYGSVPPRESPRGAVLGWLSATLILLIVAFFIWSSVFSDATRDRFTGWF